MKCLTHGHALAGMCSFTAFSFAVSARGRRGCMHMYQFLYEITGEFKLKATSESL